MSLVSVPSTESATESNTELYFEHDNWILESATSFGHRVGRDCSIDSEVGKIHFEPNGSQRQRAKRKERASRLPLGSLSFSAPQRSS